MPNDFIYIFTDASFSNSFKMAVTGYLFFNDLTELEGDDGTAKVYLTEIRELNNIRSEIIGAITALKPLQKRATKKNVLYTDCQTICDLPARRKKLEDNNFIGKASNRSLVNKDLYQEFYKLYDDLNPKLVWVKGHSSIKKRSQIQKIFSRLDRTVRSHLRQSISNSTAQSDRLRK